jgi:uncharacterized membrane protein YdjX (TVP38/TMEM64 family)
LRTATLLRLLLLALVTASMVATWAYRDWLHPLALKAQIAEHAYAPLVFLAATVTASLVFVPRTLLAIAGGLLFGLWGGLFWTTLGSTAGALLAFVVARYVNDGLIDPESWPALAPALKAAERRGWLSVAVIRVLPLPHTPVNYALGLTRLSFVDYAVGSLLGMLPSTFFAVEIGVSGESALSGRNWVVPSLVALGVLVATSLLPRLPFVKRWLGLDDQRRV